MAEFDRLCERWRLHCQREDYYSAHIISMLHNLQLDKKQRHKAKSAIDFMLDKPKQAPRKPSDAASLGLLMGMDISSNISDGLNNAGEVAARRLAGVHNISIETYDGAAGTSRVLSDDLRALLVPITDEKGIPNLHPLFTRVFAHDDTARFRLDDQPRTLGKIKSISEPMTIDGVQVYTMTIEEAA